MTWPNLPDNRLIINGEDISVKYRMALLDGYKLPPPEPKLYTIDIPGADGSLDLTEALTEDVAYKDREFEFTFAMIDVESVQRVEEMKTRINDDLHGQDFDFQMTMDPEYFYHGRFFVSYEQHGFPSGLLVTVNLKATVEPYKFKEKKTYRLNATGGREYRLESGRKPVHPVIQCEAPTKVRFGDILVDVGKGTWRMNDVVFRQGWNHIYLNSWQYFSVRWYEIGNGGEIAKKWSDLAKTRWDGVQQLQGNVMDVSNAWRDFSYVTWKELAEKQWREIDVRPVEAPENNVYIQYEWKDL
ncbi:MAG: distail tail protein [Chaetfec virus UA24_144]|nr:MAG: distail tail protein [Chaetfec virus UA24_144]